jgi:putative transposase
MRFRLIDAMKAGMTIDRMCALMDVSVSGFYAWKSREPSRRQLDDMILLAHIRAQFSMSNETYGAPRMHVELKEDGLPVGRHRIARLMRDNGLKALQKRRYKRTTDSCHGGPVAANLLDQDFTCDGPDQKWGADISYIWTCEGWLYLAIVLDLFSRRIVGWATSDRLKKDLALNALRRAIAMRQPPPGLIHHSDRGSQYCSDDYQRLLKRAGTIPSMSGKGNCYDCEYGFAA